MITARVLTNQITAKVQSSAVNLANPYTGAYEITPSQEMQVLTTEGKIMVENLVINPIPHNYGLIEQSGTVLTVR